MAKKDYAALADAIIEKVGGKSNVSFATHCITRLRFNLKDRGMVKMEEIISLPDILGAQWMGDQFQIIIGPAVADVYNTICQRGGFEKRETINENLDASMTEKQPFSPKGLGSKIIDGIVGCVVPIIPILTGSGLIKALLLILQNIGLVGAESPTVVTLTFVADSAFYFMPVFIGGFAAKKFGGNTALGAMLGAVLLHPTFVSMVGTGTAVSVFGLPVYGTTYSSTVIPAILSVWIMCYVEKLIAKHSPQALRPVLEPLLTLLIMTPVTLCALAPIGAMLSGGFASVLVWIHDKLGFFAVPLLCAVVPLVVMVGLHVGTIPVVIQSLSTLGKEQLISPAFFISNFTQGAACLAVGIRAKNPEIKSLAFSSAFSCIVPGISEPAMYGITLRYKTPMLGAMIGAIAGGLYLGIMGVGMYSLLAPNLFAFAAFIGTGNNFLNAVIGVVIGMAVALVATLLLYKDHPET